MIWIRVATLSCTDPVAAYYCALAAWLERRGRGGEVVGEWMLYRCIRCIRCRRAHNGCWERIRCYADWVYWARSALCASRGPRCSNSCCCGAVRGAQGAGWLLLVGNALRYSGCIEGRILRNGLVELHNLCRI